ncbi:MAG TPA: succinate dehydrogenase assembly factor 2 [Dongiaceae bacterium]|jgi:antitoxin CptB
MRQSPETPESQAEAGILRRRLLFQSKHRGVKELDLILGPFAERYLSEFNPIELAEYAVLLREPDPDIYDWLVGRVPLPDRLRNRVMSLLLAFGNLSPGNTVPG